MIRQWLRVRMASVLTMDFPVINMRIFPSVAILSSVLVCANAQMDMSAPKSAPGSFASQMDRSMRTMDHDMRAAPMNGDPDHDFASMMIPHHQGAIEMAKVELLHGKDPVLRRLAQEIVTDQQLEIELMRR